VLRAMVDWHRCEADGAEALGRALNAKRVSQRRESSRLP
jgi:hypothetical protein